MTQNRTLFKNKKQLITEMVSASDIVLDVGFWGQGITDNDSRWPHALLKATGAQVYGVDMSIDRERFPDTIRYLEGSAESFSFPGVQFTVIFAGDLIEHLSNPGLFLEQCKKHLAPGGRIVLTTPNTFNLFNLVEKCTKDEPTVNKDHTMYLNHKTLDVLLAKNGLAITGIGYIYSLEYTHRESLRKKFLNLVYKILSYGTYKFSETLVVTAVIA